MPRDLVFFTDRCLGPRQLPAMLRDAGMRIVTHDDLEIDHDEKDILWIPKVAALERVILTSDKRIRRDPLELRVVERSGACYFVLGRADRGAAVNASIILRYRADIERIVHAGERPLIVQLNVQEAMIRRPDGRLVLLEGWGRSGD